MLHSLKRKAPLGPGSRDGLSVHTVRDDSWRNRESCAGKPHALRGRLCLVFANTSVSAPVRGLAQRLSRCLPCHGGGVMRGPSQDASHPSDREAGLPAHAQRPRASEARVSEKKQAGNTGHSILHRCFYVIGAQSSGPSGGDCTLPRSVFLLVEQLYSDLPVLAPFSIPGVPAFSYCCVTRSEHVVQYARIPPGGGVGCP
jgi:hypothetical protein